MKKPNYVFVALSGCCDRCKELDGKKRVNKPKYTKAHPNCKCIGWDYI